VEATVGYLRGVLMSTEPFISHTHDEPDHLDDLAPATGVANAVAIGIAIVGSITFACVVLAYALSRVFS
jgi:hypothetical protein